MLRSILTLFTLPALLLLGSSSDNSAARVKQKNSQSETEVVEKLIVSGGTATMDLDLDHLNNAFPATEKPRTETLHFTLAPDSFFTVVVNNDSFRTALPGVIGLIPQNAANLPALLNASLHELVLEKMQATDAYDLVVRDGKSGFVFFNVVGPHYNYDADKRAFEINEGMLLISEEFARGLGRSPDAETVVGKIAFGANMASIEIRTIVNGQLQSAILPPLHKQGNSGTPSAPDAVSGPDVIVGDLPSMEQGGSSGSFVGLGIGTTSCNNGDQPLDWFQLSNTDHPVIPQNLYRMSGGTSNTDRFEQIGQSWLKHAFEALEDNVCAFGCNTTGCTTGTHLCPGCSDPYDASLNYSQTGLGSRAGVNPFTGAFASTANNHSGHTHIGTSHRLTVAVSDLQASNNPGATYFAEGQYITPHEYAWCQSNPGQCNMYNNVSYRQFAPTVNASPTPAVTFASVGSTVRTQPAIMAWTGATIKQVEPAPKVDGIGFVGYKVTNPSAGVWHYEYAVYNENLDRAIQSFSVPLIAGANLSNIGFHAPPQEPAWPNDGTQNNLGYSSTPWSVTQTSDSITWNSETFAQNQNANAIRWGTLYNFRFDADQPPEGINATVGYFKTGSPTTVAIQAPAGVGTPSPTPTATATVTPTT